MKSYSSREERKEEKGLYSTCCDKCGLFRMKVYSKNNRNFFCEDCFKELYRKEDQQKEIGDFS